MDSAANIVFGVVVVLALVAGGIALTTDMRPDLEGHRIIETARMWAGR